ncbi:MAG: hypothetical protein KDN18_03245 [Verrucomicrobiae bacterium]|nr:hypothetical protein [Verrucomicrobiae bacterium]
MGQDADPLRRTIPAHEVSVQANVRAQPGAGDYAEEPGIGPRWHCQSACGPYSLSQQAWSFISPDLQPEAVTTVLAQTEMLCEEWV